MAAGIINVSADVKRLSKSLDDFTKRQMPFASAKALTATAASIRSAEQKNMQAKLDRPTPFTLNSVRIKPARKNTLRATVFIQDIAASYLEPFELGGMHKINNGASSLFTPINQSVNQYGNLPRNKIEQLKSRPDVFVGAVKTKNGNVINGVWQRIANVNKVSLLNAKGKKLTALNKTGHLKLLIEFTAPKEVTQHLGWFELAKKIAKQEMPAALKRELAAAMRSAK